MAGAGPPHGVQPPLPAPQEPPARPGSRGRADRPIAQWQPDPDGAAAAVLTGARSFAAIAEWAADTPQPIRAALGARHDPLAGFLVPTEATIRRTLGRLDATPWPPQWATGWSHATVTTTPPPRSGHGSGRWPSMARRCAAPTHPTATAAPSTCWRRWSNTSRVVLAASGMLAVAAGNPACPGPGDRRALEAGFAACLPGAAWMTPEWVRFRHGRT